jgi:cytochrome c553
VDGRGRGGAFPALAAQRPEYLAQALGAYAEGRRFSGIMEPIATALSPEARAAAARYYAGLARATPRVPEAGGARSRGEAIAALGVPEREVPACASCHGPTETSLNTSYPRLDGLAREYLVRQLHLFQQRKRGGSEYGHIMLSFVDRLTATQIDEVATYFAELGR